MLDREKANLVIGEMITKKRESLEQYGAGLVKSIADELELSKQSIYHIENGRGSIRFVDFCVYCKKIGLSKQETAEFFTEIIKRIVY